MRVIRWTQTILLAVVAMLAAAHVARAEVWKLSAGVDYTSGDYGGDEDITTAYVPFTIKYRGARWGARITVPYLEVSGPATVLDADGQLISGPDRTERGLGDVIGALTLYDVVSLPENSFYVDATAKLKIATADEEQGLGTGETDYAFQVDWYKDFERAGLFGALGYKMYGDPAGFDLDNAVFASIGGDYRLAGTTRAGLIYDYRESAIAGGDALQELTLFVSFAGLGGASIQPYVLTGLSDASPDWGAGIMVNVRRGAR